MTNRVVLRLLFVVVYRRSIRCSWRRRLQCLPASSTSLATNFSLAGFQVTTYGRFWVTPEAGVNDSDVIAMAVSHLSWVASPGSIICAVGHSCAIRIGSRKRVARRSSGFEPNECPVIRFIARRTRSINHSVPRAIGIGQHYLIHSVSTGIDPIPISQTKAGSRKTLVDVVSHYRRTTSPGRFVPQATVVDGAKANIYSSARQTRNWQIEIKVCASWCLGAFYCCSSLLRPWRRLSWWCSNRVCWSKHRFRLIASQGHSKRTWRDSVSEQHRPCLSCCRLQCGMCACTHARLTWT